MIAYPKYVPASIASPWRRGNISFRRVMEQYGAASYLRILDLLRKEKPHYIVRDRFLNVELIEVPVSDIRVHYKPEERAREVWSSPRDELERAAKNFIELLQDWGVPLSHIGITGSILLRIHNVKLSDIDVLVYSKRYSTLVTDMLEEALRKNVVRIPEHYLRKWARDIARTYPCLDEATAARLVLRRKHRIVYQDRVYSINFVRVEEEVKEQYGDYVYKSIRPIRVKARIVDASESLFLPGVYYVDDVKPIDQLDIPKITQIVTFEGLYSGIAKEREEVVVYGMLEEVTSTRSGETYYRIVVGSANLRSMDYILPLSLLS